ncbi:MAG: hypothetical protein JNK04_07285 [Myxococcales bacterium]|nr:hypothetical protein [Myxococcales bacterium]
MAVRSKTLRQQGERRRPEPDARPRIRRAVTRATSARRTVSAAKRWPGRAQIARHAVAPNPPTGKRLPSQGIIMVHPVFSPAEAAALLGLPERHVRKEIEHGLLSAGSPPRLEFPALVYLEALRLMDLDLRVDDRKKVLATITSALARRRSNTIELSSVLRLEIGTLVRDL